MGDVITEDESLTVLYDHNKAKNSYRMNKGSFSSFIEFTVALCPFPPPLSSSHIYKRQNVTQIPS